MTRRVSWHLLSRWASELLQGVSLEQQKSRALADFPAYAAEIRQQFELGRVQLRAIESLGERDEIAFGLSLWRWFREPVENEAG